MTISEFSAISALIVGIAWPIVAVVALLVLHKPIGRFLEDIVKRVTKLSAFDFSIEFATISSPPPPWEDPTINEGFTLIGGVATSTTIQTLFKQIRNDTTWHYLIVDIGKGERWLVSRLFLFIVILQYMGGLRCVAFVESKDETIRRLLGIAHPDRVRIVLAQKYPWFNQALVEAWSAKVFPILAAPLPKDKAEHIVNAFMQNPQIQLSDAPKDSKDEWEQLRPNTNLWEHTKWLDLQRVNDDLRDIFYDRDACQYTDSPDTPVSERNKAVLRRQVPFVALVNEKGELKGLVDRYERLDKLAVRSGEAIDDHSTVTDK